MNILSCYETFFSHLQSALPPSAHVDMMLLLLGLKPCLRTRKNIHEDSSSAIGNWCKKWHFYFHIDQEEFIYLSPQKELVRQLVQIDHSNQKHEDLLGKLLGYPKCCCKKIAEIGEENIDAYEANLVKKKFPFLFRLINPKNYKKGTAFISHVPCSATCLNSLLIAQKFCNFLNNHKNYYFFEGWIKELRNIRKTNVNRSFAFKANY